MFTNLILLNIFYNFQILFLPVIGYVIELDSRFSEVVTEGQWLVKFYAPWCGYCKKLEPIYEELSVVLQNMPIKVARLDATKYPEAAARYHVRGYPTIKYINGTEVYTHDGDRTVYSLVQFSKRSLGPALRHLPSEGRLREALIERRKETFFLYIGSSQTYLKSVFEDIAKFWRLYSYYYSIEDKSIPKDILSTITITPTLDEGNGTILVWKNKNIKIIYKHSGSLDSLNSSLRNWININRFPIFPKVSRSDIMDLGILQKPIVILLLNSSEVDGLEDQYHDVYLDVLPSRRYFFLGEKLSISEDSSISKFTVGWTTDTSSMSDLAMTILLPPNVVIFNPSNQTVYLHPNYHELEKMAQLNEAAITNHLSNFQRGLLQGYGGTGFLAKMHRALYDFVTGLIEFVTAAPLLAMFIIGIPLSVVSFLFYAICCMDTNDSPEYRRAVRAQRKEKTPLYRVPLRSSEELNIKTDGDKKND